MKNIPWYAFTGTKGFERLKKYVELVFAFDDASSLANEAAQWKFLTDAPELAEFLTNRTAPFTPRIEPAYNPLLTTVTRMSNLQPPPLFNQSETHHQNLLSKRFAQREVSQDSLDRQGRYIQIHGITHEAQNINTLIKGMKQSSVASNILERDEMFRIGAPAYSVPGDKRSNRHVVVAEFRELLYFYSGLEKPEKDLPNQTFKMVKKWTQLTNQKKFSEKQRLILSHSFGISHTFVVMILQAIKRLDAMILSSGASVRSTPEYEKNMSMLGYISHLTQLLEDFHSQFFSTTSWNSLSGDRKIRTVQDFYRIFSVMTSTGEVPYSDDTLLNFAPLEVVKQWQPLFAEYKKNKGAFLSAKQLTTEQELLTNRQSIKPPPTKKKPKPKPFKPYSFRGRGRGRGWRGWRGWGRGRGRGRGKRGRGKGKRGRGRRNDNNNNKRKAEDDPNPKNGKHPR